MGPEFFLKCYVEFKLGLKTDTPEPLSHCLEESDNLHTLKLLAFGQAEPINLPSTFENLLVDELYSLTDGKELSYVVRYLEIQLKNPPSPTELETIAKTNRLFFSSPVQLAGALIEQFNTVPKNMHTTPFMPQSEVDELLK